MREERVASWVGDARKILQDFVAPELRAIAARLDESERRDMERDKLATKRHLALLDKIEATRRELTLHTELAIAKNRLQDFESRQSSVQPSSSPV